MQLQIQICNTNIKMTVIHVLSRILSTFPEVYFEENANHSKQSQIQFFHSIVEIFIHPLQETSKANEELLSSSLQALPSLATLLKKANLITEYSSIICYLLLHVPTEKYSNSILLLLISALHSLIQCDSSSQTFISCLFTLLQSSSSSSSTMILSLLSSSHVNCISQSLHEQILSAIISWLQNENRRENVISILLSWFNRSSSSSSSSSNQTSNVVVWYLNHITSWILCYLMQLDSIAQETFVLDCIKVLVVAHSFSKSRKVFPYFCFHFCLVLMCELFPLF